MDTGTGNGEGGKELIGTSAPSTSNYLCGLRPQNLKTIWGIITPSLLDLFPDAIPPSTVGKARYGSGVSRVRNPPA